MVDISLPPPMFSCCSHSQYFPNTAQNFMGVPIPKPKTTMMRYDELRRNSDECKIKINSYVNRSCTLL